MFDPTKYVLDYDDPGLRCYRRTIGNYKLSINVGASYSDPGIFQDINLYKRVKLEILNNKGYVIFKNESDKMGVNKIINSTGNYSNYRDVDIQLIESVEKAIFSYQGLLQFTTIQSTVNQTIKPIVAPASKPSDIIGPCCCCGSTDKWNSFKDNKWFCYKHCDY